MQRTSRTNSACQPTACPCRVIIVFQQRCVFIKDVNVKLIVVDPTFLVRDLRQERIETSVSEVYGLT